MHLSLSSEDQDLLSKISWLKHYNYVIHSQSANAYAAFITYFLKV